MNGTTSLSLPVTQFEIGELRNFVYLILDSRSRKAAIVDPQSDLSAPLRLLEDNGYALEAVLLTHTHHDHVAGVPELSRRFPAIPIRVHREDSHRLKSMAGAKILETSDDEKFQIGQVTVQALHTPGHSAGEICYLVSSPESATPHLLTGDTVFIRDCGRTDFATGSNEEMFASLQRLKRLAPKTVIWPGHHYAPEFHSTLEREMRESPPFQCRSVEELKALP